MFTGEEPGSPGCIPLEAFDAGVKCRPNGSETITNNIFPVRARTPVDVVMPPLSPLTIVPLDDRKTWRVIWTDGRELPKEIPEERFYGYSVGKWVDDTTLVVQTVPRASMATSPIRKAV